VKTPVKAKRLKHMLMVIVKAIKRPNTQYLLTISGATDIMRNTPTAVARDNRYVNTLKTILDRLIYIG
jgi:hypothetical protein